MQVDGLVELIGILRTACGHAAVGLEIEGRRERYVSDIAERIGGALGVGEIAGQDLPDSRLRGMLCIDAEGGERIGEQALVADELRHQLQRLGDEGLRDVAVLRLAGNSDREIAAALSCSLRTVERRHTHIRQIWSQGQPS